MVFLTNNKFGPLMMVGNADDTCSCSKCDCTNVATCKTCHCCEKCCQC